MPGRVLHSWSIHGQGWVSLKAYLKLKFRKIWANIRQWHLGGWIVQVSDQRYFSLLRTETSRNESTEQLNFESQERGSESRISPKKGNLNSFSLRAFRITCRIGLLGTWEGVLPRKEMEGERERIEGQERWENKLTQRGKGSQGKAHLFKVT